MSRKYLGLDIGAEALSAVLIEIGLKRRGVESCVRIPIARSGTFEDNLNQAFKTLIDTVTVNGCTSVISIPTEKVTSRNMTVPFTDSKKIRQILPFELEPIIPFPIENLAIDFQKVETTEAGARILTIIGQIPDLSLYLQAAGTQHIDPETLLPGAYATAALLAGNADMPENWMLLDMFPERFTFFLIHNRKISLIRSFPVALSSADAGETICRRIQQTMAGLDAILKGGGPLADSLLSGAWVTGPEAGNDTLLSSISQGLELPIHKLDLFKTYELDKTGWEETHLPPHQMNNALAGALLTSEGPRNTINLRQGPLVQKSRFFEYKQAFYGIAATAAVAILFVFGNLLAEIYILEKEAARLNTEVINLFKSILPETRTIVEPVHQLQVEIEELKKKSFAKADTGSYLPAIDILFHLSREIPSSIDVRFSKLVVGDQSIMISGTTDSFNSVNEMKGRLEKNALFKSVKINSADMEQAEKRVRFKIQIQL